MSSKSPKTLKSKSVSESVSVKFQQAFAAHQKGMLTEAQALYEEILKRHPDHFDALHLLGVIAHQARRPQLSVDLIDKAIKLNPNNATFYSNRGNALKELGQSADAITNYDKAIQLNSGFIDAYYNRGNVLQILKRHDAAIESYDKAIQLRPDHASAYLNRGSALNGLGKLDAAIESYDKAIQLSPDYAEAYCSRGNVLKERGQHDEAIRSYDRAIEINPYYVDAYFNRGIAYQDWNQSDCAIENYDKAIQLRPDFVGAYYNRGIVYQELKQLDEAVESYNKAIQLKPGYEEAYCNRGNALRGLKQFGAAIESYDIAIRLKPDYAEAYSNRGIAYQDLKQLDAAIESYDEAIQLKPDYAEAYSNRGNALKDHKQPNLALASYDKAIQLKPDFIEAYFNRGNLLVDLKKLDAAIESYDKAIQLKPDYAEAYSNRGNAQNGTKRSNAAIQSYAKAIQLNPDYAEAYSNRGDLLRSEFRYVEALHSVTKAIQIDPRLAVAQQTYSATLAHLSDYRDVVAHSNIASTLAPDDLSIYESRLYTWIYHPDLSAEEICAEHVRWGKRFPDPESNLFDLHDRTLKRRLRVGYVSPDFRGHSCRFYFDPLFSQHDHTRFELFAYSNVQSEDEHTHRLKGYFDTWRDIWNFSDQDVAEMVRHDQIDILVDACGHMRDTRLEIFALKPAPIQVTWLGAAWTTGLKQMDYALFDPYMAPEGTHTSEVIVRLPRTWAAYRPSEKATNTAVTILPALKNGYITFGYSGRSERLNYKVFQAWGELLKRLPEARLIVDYRAFSDPLTQAYYKDFMGQHGIDMSRVTMRNSSNIFEGLGEIDIILDSFPHSGGTMLFDALWMGVPTVTIASRPPVGRVGTSLMTNLGLPHWVAQDAKGYVDKAIEFAADIPGLAEIRAGMRERMRASPVMDEKGFARDVEDAYAVMWQDWCSKVSAL